MPKKNSTPKPSPHVPKASDFKVPWWSRMLGDFRAYRRARLARQEARKEFKSQKWIATVIVWTKRGEHPWQPSYFQLYEEAGKRKYNFVKGAISMHAGSYTQFQKWVLPWTYGNVSNSDIKRIADMSERTPT